MVHSIALFEIAQCHMQTNGEKENVTEEKEYQSHSYTRCSVLHECIWSLQTILLQSVLIRKNWDERWKTERFGSGEKMQ